MYYTAIWQYPTLGDFSAKSGKGKMAACSFSAEAERHSLKRSSRVTTDWMSNAFALRFRPLAETKVRLIFYHQTLPNLNGIDTKRQL
jgi:hypothetical protein